MRRRRTRRQNRRFCRPAGFSRSENPRTSGIRRRRITRNLCARSAHRRAFAKRKAEDTNKLYICSKSKTRATRRPLSGRSAGGESSTCEEGLLSSSSSAAVERHEGPADRSAVGRRVPSLSTARKGSVSTNRSFNALAARREILPAATRIEDLSARSAESGRAL